MKIKLLYASAIAVAMLCVAYKTISQALVDQVDVQPVDVQDKELSTLPVVYFDPETWEVIASDSPDDDLSNYNKPEQLEARQNGALAVLDPVEYAKRVLKTAEEQAQADEAAARVVNPPALSFEGKSDEERKAVEDAIFAIMNPIEAAAEQSAEEEQSQSQVGNPEESSSQP